MSKKNRKSKTDYGEHREIFSPEPGFAASATECTGLMPTPPENRSEEESYRQLVPTEVPLYAPGAGQIKEGIYDSKVPENRV